jgi:Asp-tRNA(Asn)/Glu-tRNA(Gln) amidotransferase A subunit family amidase
MPLRPSPLEQHRRRLATGELSLPDIAAQVIAAANSNASRNTYLRFEPGGIIEQDRALADDYEAGREFSPLFAVPVSLKDCFDLRYTVTSAGTRFYALKDTAAEKDSAVAARLHELGCIITGKTHLHPLAWGITGQNPDFGDCLQPRDPSLLTGGSSSGAAASVQEGSALFAIGTDTGGSIRVPAALCGLAGFRASHAITRQWPEMWDGAIPLSPSFDTLGFLCRDPRDLQPIATELFRFPSATVQPHPNIGAVATSFLSGADPDSFEGFAAWLDMLSSLGSVLGTFNADSWNAALDIFRPIQASEAAAIHRGHFDRFDASLNERLHWGASLSEAEVAAAREQHTRFRAQLDALFARFDFVIAPASPTSRLLAGADHTHARSNILRYTVPFSLGGNPVATLPGEWIGAPLGTGLQIAAAPHRDPELLALVTAIATQALKRR